MMITVANPIYDTVFKYLMEDERVAKDEDMKRIIHRLLSAASDANLRQDMNVEDEYFAAIENRDTAIMQRDQRIAEQDAQLAEQNAQLAEQNAQLAEQNAQLAEQELMLSKTIQMLLCSGLDIEAIAKNMNISRNEVQRIAKL